MAAEQRRQKLREINAEISERSAYLVKINDDIDTATIAGSDRLRELAGEITALEDEKARLMKQNLGLEQKIRENKLRIAETSH